MSEKQKKTSEKRIYVSTGYISSTGIMSQRGIQAMCKDGKIDGAVRFGNTWRINRESFNRQFGTNL